MAEIQLYAPMAGTQLSSSMVQPQNHNCLIGPQLLNVIVRPQLLNIIVRTQLLLSAIEADNPTVYLHEPKSTPNCFFFKIFKFSGPSRPGMTSHSSPISYLGFIITIVIVISFARESKLYPMLCTWWPELFKAQPNWMIKYN